MWTWSSGITTNMAVGAGLTIGYSPTWDGLVGASIGAGIDGGFKIVGATVMAVRRCMGGIMEGRREAGGS